jgi:hypothetical protein
MFLARGRLTSVAAGSFSYLFSWRCFDFMGFRVVIGMTILVNDCTILQNPNA